MAESFAEWEFSMIEVFLKKNEKRMAVSFMPFEGHELLNNACFACNPLWMRLWSQFSLCNQDLVCPTRIINFNWLRIFQNRFLCNQVGCAIFKIDFHATKYGKALITNGYERKALGIY
ncbi:MAG: hypothetical protein QM737_12855 [Ferruginibacter sp.]